MLRYCDYIADRIKKSLLTAMTTVTEPVQIESVGKIEYDMGPGGAFVSTKKTIRMSIEGIEYKITVEEV